MNADRYRAGKRLWSAADDQLLRRLYPDTPTRLLATRLHRSLTAVYARAGILGLTKSAAYLESPAACHLRRDNNPGVATRFQKGQAPANKGLRRPGWFRGRMRETQFKRGQRNGQAARLYRPVGSTRVIDGYVYRKVSDVPNVPYTVNWKLESHLVWKQAGRDIPPSHALAFKNGNPLDVRLENLELITRRQNMARNSIHNLPEALADTVRLLGALHRQIRRRTRGEEQDRRPA